MAIEIKSGSIKRNIENDQWSLRNPIGSYSLKLALMTTIATSALSLPVMAEDKNTAIFEEVVVTATRRAQSIQEVPYNISAVIGDDIKKGALQSSSDFLASIPGVFVSSVGGRAQLNNGVVLRGLNAVSPVDNAFFQNVGEPTVSTYIGETPLFVNMRLADINRIEILRGPQGTLYGSGSVGGTVKYVFNEPDFEEASLSINGDFGAPGNSGEYDYSINLVGNLPITDRSALRIAAGYEKLGGVVDALSLVQLGANGDPVLSDPGNIDSEPLTERVNDSDDSELLYIRAMYGLEISESTELLLTFFRQENEYDGESFRSLSSSTGLDGPAWGHNQPSRGNGEFDTNLFSAELTMDLGFATVTSVTSYTESSGQTLQESSDIYIPLTDYYYGYPRLDMSTTATNQDAEIFTQEIRLVSETDSNWSWVAGVFYKKEDRKADLIDDIPGFHTWATDPTSSGSVDIAQAYYGLSTVDELLDYFGATREGGFEQAPFAYDREVDFEDIALFGEVTYNVTEAWQITAGARVFWQDFDQVATLRLPLCGPACALDETDPLGSTLSQSNSDFSDQIFKFNTSYKITEDHMVYLTVSEGFRHGGANAIPIFSPEELALIPFSQDEVTNYELGLKGSLDSKLLQYTITFYRMDWEAPQIDTFVGQLLAPAVINGSKARTQGLEIQLDWSPLENLDIGFAYNYIDAKITESATLASGSMLVEGDRLPASSKHQVGVSLDYTHVIEDDNFVTFHVDGNYRSDFATNYNDTFENFVELDGYLSMNMAINWQKGRYTLGAYVRNLTNQEGISALTTVAVDIDPAVSRVFVQRPRTFGIKWGVDF